MYNFCLVSFSTSFDFLATLEPSRANPGRFLWAERTQGTTSRPVDTYSVDGFNPQQTLMLLLVFMGKNLVFLGGQKPLFFHGILRAKMVSNEMFTNINAVDGRNPANHLRMFKSNRINYQPQVVQDFVHQQYLKQMDLSFMLLTQVQKILDDMWVRFGHVLRKFSLVLCAIVFPLQKENKGLEAENSALFSPAFQKSIAPGSWWWTIYQKCWWTFWMILW